MFVRKVRSSCFSVIFSIESCGCCSAALFTRMSILPNSFMVCSIAFRQNISCNKETSAFCLLNQTLGFVGVFVLFQINDRDISAFFCKGNGNRAANSAVTAGDNSRLVSQFIAAATLPVLGYRRRLHLVFAAWLLVLVLSRLKLLFFGHNPPLSTQNAMIAQRRRLRVRAAFFAAAERDLAERRPAARFACRESAFLDADRRLSRFSAPLVARERLREGFLRRPARPLVKSRLACRLVRA